MIDDMMPGNAAMNGVSLDIILFFHYFSLSASRIGYSNKRFVQSDVTSRKKKTRLYFCSFVVDLFIVCSCKKMATKQ